MVDYDENEMRRIDEELNEFYRAEKIFRFSMHTFGLVGNSLMFVAYHTGSLRQLSVSIYFRCMAIVCSCQNVYFLLWIEYLCRLSSRSELFYKLFNYAQNLFVCISVWLEVAASLDRFLTIVFPIHVSFIKKPLVQRIVIAMVVFYNMAFYSCILVKMNYRVEEKDYESQANFMNTLYVMDLANSSAVPFSIMFVSSVATFVGVVRSHRRAKSLGRLTSSQRTLTRDMKFGVTLIVLNALFFSFNSIYRLNNVAHINPFDPRKQTVMFFVFASIISNLSEYYYSLNFYVQLWVNSLVRKQISKLVVVNFIKFKTFLWDKNRPISGSNNPTS